MSVKKELKVGLIIGSQRPVRVAPQIADFVLDIVKAAVPEASSETSTRPEVIFDRIDLATQGLPIFDEPGIPAQIKSPEAYKHEHTRAWARRVTACDAFIFVSSQRNWGIPSELKNAIDFLFNEWKGKTAMLVTYGGHGGDKCAAQLKIVLSSIGMRVQEKAIQMSFPSADFRVKAFQGEDVGLDASNDTGPWAEHRAEIVAVWNELVSKTLEPSG